MTRTRTQELQAMPLFVCGECGRLAYKLEVIPGCPECECAMTRIEYPTSSDHFEAIGQHFYRDTGYVRPGKDCRFRSREERQEVFDWWNQATAARPVQ